MVSLFRRTRSAILCNQYRKLSIHEDACSVPTFDINTERKAFLKVLPEVINSVITGPKISQLPEISSRVKQLMDYTMGKGKLLRGLKVPIGYRMLEDPSNFSEETRHSAYVLGWTVEMMQSYLLLLDDMMDGGTMRRGKPCWHLLPNVGLAAINDCTLIYQSLIEVLEMYFGETPVYTDLLHLFNEALTRSSMGEHLDLTTSYNKQRNNLEVFTLKNCNNIATAKTAHVSFKLPVQIVLVLLKNGKKIYTKEIDYICLELGRLLQIQDDYIDVYGDTTTIGKVGSDIQEGKCTWVAVTALQRCNEAQRSIFKNCYGSKDPADVERIKQLYDDLHMPQVYQQCELSVYVDLMSRIRALPTERETMFFLEILRMYFRRHY